MPHTYLLIEDVAERYRTTVNVIRKKTAVNEIPFTKRPGFGRLFFRPDHLDSWDDGAELQVVDLPGGGKLVRPKEAV